MREREREPEKSGLWVIYLFGGLGKFKIHFTQGELLGTGYLLLNSSEFKSIFIMRIFGKNR